MVKQLLCFTFRRPVYRCGTERDIPGKNGRETVMEKKVNGFYGKYVKRALDIFCSGLAMLLFSWLYLILAILVKVNLGSPIIFKQERPGMIDPKTGKEKIFNLYKFRSMTDARDENGNLLPDSKRLTKFGKLLRKTSLDELPEAWNIFKGDMSIVGPRPWLVRYLKYYTDYERQRHLVRPGLTGWAQVNGRNSAGWGERFKYDIEYVNHVSFGMDLKVIAKTVMNLFKPEGIDFEKGHQTLREYFEERNGGQSEKNA